MFKVFTYMVWGNLRKMLINPRFRIITLPVLLFENTFSIKSLVQSLIRLIMSSRFTFVNAVRIWLSVASGDCT